MAQKGERDTVKEQYWRDTLADWQKSSVRMSEYCRQHGLDYRLFSKWKQIIKRRDAEGAVHTTGAGHGKHLNTRSQKAAKPAQQSKKRAQIDFVPVSLTGNNRYDTGSRATSLEVELRCGLLVRMSHCCSPEYLSSIISALENR